MTRRTIDLMEQAGDQPWLCHLSFKKLHWSYIVPAPYHDMHGPEHVIPPVHRDAEKDTDHPVHETYIESRIYRTFAGDDVRERFILACMGLIKKKLTIRWVSFDLYGRNRVDGEHDDRCDLRPLRLPW